jgi:hypothetical protein
VDGIHPGGMAICIHGRELNPPACCGPRVQAGVALPCAAMRLTTVLACLTYPCIHALKFLHICVLFDPGGCAVLLLVGCVAWACVLGCAVYACFRASITQEPWIDSLDLVRPDRSGGRAAAPSPRQYPSLHIQEK